MGPVFWRAALSKLGCGVLEPEQVEEDPAPLNSLELYPISDDYNFNCNDPIPEIKTVLSSECYAHNHENTINLEKNKITFSNLFGHFFS